MDNANLLIDGLVMFVSFVGLVVLHEFAHAWMAHLCGDDTPRLQGRLTLDPAAHIDLVGTIILPLVMILISYSSGGGSFFGWGKPVMVNLYNFRHRRRDDILVAAAGPAMNLLAAFVILAFLKMLTLAGIFSFNEMGGDIARFSVFLCFFNLMPIPPLDGGHIMRNLIGISDETYRKFSQYSFFLFLLVMQIPVVSHTVNFLVDRTFSILARPFFGG